VRTSYITSLDVTDGTTVYKCGRETAYDRHNLYKTQVIKCKLRVKIEQGKRIHCNNISDKCLVPPHEDADCPTCSGWPRCYDHSFPRKGAAPDSCSQMQLEGTIQANDSQY